MSDEIIQIEKFLLDFQKRFCQKMAELDGSKDFLVDQWQRDSQSTLGGSGISRVLENGKVFERAGANFSHVFGNHLPAAASSSRPELAGAKFSALGVSIVMHPRNPYAPTSHANVRYFEALTAEGKKVWWFGGGFDLTPYYAFDQDCINWHKAAKAACDSYSADAYQKFKTWADEYFYLKHRQECRGIGGIFYDDLHEGGFDKCFAFMKSVAEHYLQVYAEIIALRKDHPYSDRERNFQLMRRGRYVEFNLLYDRGTLFGLQSGGRTESILVSMPPLVNWRYDAKAAPNSEEAKLVEYYLKPRDWV